MVCIHWCFEVRFEEALLLNSEPQGSFSPRGLLTSMCRFFGSVEITEFR